MGEHVDEVEHYDVQIVVKQIGELAEEFLACGRVRYAWLEWDNASMSGKFLQTPEREEIPENIKEQLIVNLYSK